MIRIGLLGATGRMGKSVQNLLQSEFAEQAALAAAVKMGDSLTTLLDTEVVIDFSSPTGMLSMAETALNSNRPLPAFVIGSTGWKPAEREIIETLATKTPVLMASNFSIGVLVLTEILKTATPLLEKLGYTPVLIETHHRHKKDAPSGTALTLEKVISLARKEPVQTLSVRAGEVIGDHEVTFYSAGDEIKVGHFAQDRTIFARGAIQAALWLGALRKQDTHTHPHSILGIDAFFSHLKHTV